MSIVVQRIPWINYGGFIKGSPICYSTTFFEESFVYSDIIFQSYTPSANGGVHFFEIALPMPFEPGAPFLGAHFTASFAPIVNSPNTINIPLYFLQQNATIRVEFPNFIADGVNIMTGRLAYSVLPIPIALDSE